MAKMPFPVTMLGIRQFEPRSQRERGSNRENGAVGGGVADRLDRTHVQCEIPATRGFRQDPFPAAVDPDEIVQDSVATSVGVDQDVAVAPLVGVVGDDSDGGEISPRDLLLAADDLADADEEHAVALDGSGHQLDILCPAIDHVADRDGFAEALRVVQVFQSQSVRMKRIAHETPSWVRR